MDQGFVLLQNNYVKIYVWITKIFSMTSNWLVSTKAHVLKFLLTNRDFNLDMFC